MRSILALGVVSLTVAAGLVACGDDSSDDGPSLGGTGGAAAGTGGASAGTGGAAAGTGGATAGTGGASAGTGGGGAGGAPAVDVSPKATCTGCVELIVPATGPNDNGGTTNVADQAIFQINYAAPGADFSDGVVTWRVAAVEANANAFVSLFAQNGPSTDPARNYAGIYPATQYYTLAAATFPANTFVDLTLDISAFAANVASDAGTPEPEPVADAGDGGAPLDPGNFDKSAVQALGVQVGVTGTATGSAVVRVAIDSVTITGVPDETTPTRNFNTTLEGLTQNSYQLPPGTPMPVIHPVP